jgi:hypothetical protein
LYAELWLDRLTSLTDIQTAITSQIDTLTDQQNELITQANVRVAEIIRAQKQKVQEKQEIQKKVLNFLHAIWIDRIPQATLNTIIANINANLTRYGLQKPIDLDNASLGFDFDLWNKDISELEKQKFIELYNKILTWNKTYPVRLENWRIQFFDSHEAAKANIPANAMFDIWAFANIRLWTEPTFQAMMNLSKNDNIGN